MIKRSIAIILAVVLVFSLAFVFAGCGAKETSQNTGSQQSSGGSQQASAGSSSSSGPVTIEYWQYFFETKVKLIDELIKEFESKNPGIKVEHKHFPYDSYQQKVAAAISTGTGPNIINLFYGWVPKYVKSQSLQPLPEDAFPPEQIEKEFAPMVKFNKIDVKYYTIPTAVRTLALFWNKDIFKDNGLDPEKPPKTLDELVEMAKKCTKRNNGVLEIAGMTFQPSGQLHAWFRPVLLEQFGQQPMSDDFRKVTWNGSEAGYKAFEFLVDLARKHQVGENNFYTDDATAFISGKAALHIDGSYRLGALKSQAPDLNYGVAPLPEYNGKKSSFGSYWTNGITVNTKGDQLDASVKFLQFLVTPEVMKRWTIEIGEIAAKVELANDPELLKDEKLAPFIQSLPYSTSYFYVDEAADRKALLDAIDQVLLNNVDPRKALDEATAQVQKLLDEFWSN